MTNHKNIFLILATLVFLSSCVTVKQHNLALKQQNYLECTLDSLNELYFKQTTSLKDSILEANLKFDSLSIEHHSLKVRFDSFYIEFQNLADSINQLKITSASSNKDLQSKNANLEKSIKKLNQKITLLNSKINSLTSNSIAERISFGEHTFDAYIVDFPREKIQIYWKNEKGAKLTSITSLKKYVETKGKELIFATNAGMYTPDNSPQGLYIENGKELIPINLEVKEDGNFYMQPNGVFLISKTEAKVVSSTEFSQYKAKALYATQSGPMLVIDGAVNSKFTKGSTNVYIRSGVGITKDGTVVFAISNELINFYDFATFFKETLKCNNALYLDGAISKMYLPKLDRHELGGSFGAIIGITK